MRQLFLHQNFPNPRLPRKTRPAFISSIGAGQAFNPNTVIKYQIPQETYVVLRVYDILGKAVAQLVNGIQEPGYYQVTLDASRLSSGLYFYRMQAGNYTMVKKMLVVK